MYHNRNGSINCNGRTICIFLGIDEWDLFELAHEDAIAEYKEINGDIDIRDARFVRLVFV